MAILAVDRVIDKVAEALHWSPAVDLASDVLLALVVAIVLQQRFELVTAQLQNFASEVAHQLRTPLAIQRTVGELGLRRPMSAVQYQDTIDGMLEETDHLLSFVEALLLIAQIDSGELRLTLTKLQVSELVGEVTDELRVLAEEKSQTLSIDTRDDALIEADRAMFRQVLMNLLSNAIKYTHEGGAVQVRTRRLSARKVEIVVGDNGPGIHTDDQKKVFEKFYRAFADQEGTGLGLAITKRIVEAHKGQISCDSKLGEGCHFTVQVPICRSSSVSSS